MKLSLAWLCDHLGISFSEIDVPVLIARLNETTAEIDSVTEITCNIDAMVLGRVQEIHENGVVVEILGSWSRKNKNFVSDFSSCSPAQEKRQILSQRKDAELQRVYLLISDASNMYRWATMQDFGGGRSDLIPFLREHALFSSQLALESKDYILELDNKSINHRPDLWSHRGFAREVGAILKRPLCDEAAILKTVEIVKGETKVSTDNLTLKIDYSQGCTRLAALSLQNIVVEGADIVIASRLARLDVRPQSLLIDLTNYVMFDIGQPLHAFDADTFADPLIVAQRGDGSLLTLLDGQQIETAGQEVIISDGTCPRALAGIMGGKSSSISATTKNIYLESAHFDPTVIRKASVRVKKRTEASTRFEKSLDPNQNTKALERYLMLLDKNEVRYLLQGPLISVGKESFPRIIMCSHELIEKKLGIVVQPTFVKDVLEQLHFKVDVIEGEYKVVVPTFRLKDVAIVEDVIEEVGRCISSTLYTLELPSRLTAPFTITSIRQVREIKHLLAFSLGMHEVYNYNLFDNDFIKKFDYEPDDGLKLKNPVSEVYTHLVTSLLPGLLKNVYENEPKARELRFFESARRWVVQEGRIVEKKSIAGVFWNKDAFDFYEGKDKLVRFFQGLGISVIWKKEFPGKPWWSRFITAGLYVNEVCIGYAGMIDQKIMMNLMKGHAFIFECDLDRLISMTGSKIIFKPLAKYQSVDLDISLFVPFQVVVSQLEKEIFEVDSRIKNVELVDFYEKPEWLDHRSVTLRFVIQDPQKTLTSDEIECVYQAVKNRLVALGGSIR